MNTQQLTVCVADIDRYNLATRHLTLEQIAAAAGVSLRQLFLLFSREMRGSPHRYLLDVRLEHAQKLVLANDLRMSEIAAACGFGTTRTLARAFHQQVGMAPAKWGEKMRMDTSD